MSDNSHSPLSPDAHYDNVRELYLNAEPALLAAIKRGERKEARSIINRVLVYIYSFGMDRLDLLKAFQLELVVMLSRASVEAGGKPAEIFGQDFEALKELAELSDEEDLCLWLRRMLERSMDAIERNQAFPNSVLLQRALVYMEEHLHQDLSRDEVARAAGLSGSHFSHLIKRHTGKTFTFLLQQKRINRARSLLSGTDDPLADIADQCGFCDQSYFTKIFRKHTGRAPGDFRKAG